MIDLEGIVRAAVADAVAPLATEVAQLRQLVEAQATPSVYVDSATAAKLAGFRTTAALRAAARRHPGTIGAARAGRRWDRARLLAAIAAMSR
jgi:hypothetical protein